MVSLLRRIVTRQFPADHLIFPWAISGSYYSFHTQKKQVSHKQNTGHKHKIKLISAVNLCGENSVPTISGGDDAPDWNTYFYNDTHYLFFMVCAVCLIY